MSLVQPCPVPVDAAAPLASFCRAELRDLRAFLRRPVPSRRLARASQRPVLRVALLLALIWTFMLAVSVPLDSLLERWTSLREAPLPAGTDWLTLLLVGPLVEELVCRAGLRSPAWALGLSLPLFIGLASGSWPLALAMLSAVLAAGTWAMLDRSPESRFARRRAFLRHYRWVFWIYAIGFGIAHLSRFTAGADASLLALAAITPHLFGGALLGYVRLRDGLASSIALHIAHNSVAWLLGPLLFP